MLRIVNIIHFIVAILVAKDLLQVGHVLEVFLFSIMTSGISAKVLYIPCETDMYFHIDAMAHEAEFLKNGRFLPLKSDWGHLAGGGFAPQDAKFLNAAIHNFLAEPAD